jgi:hypothetical protein
MWENALMAFANGAGRGVTSSGAPMTLQSGAPADMRAGFSNAGWTVSTGSSRAEGARLTGDPAQAVYGGSGVMATSTAGGGMLLPLLIGGAVLAFVIAKKKKG